jgi:hypothetical protein
MNEDLLSLIAWRVLPSDLLDYVHLCIVVFFFCLLLQARQFSVSGTKDNYTTRKKRASGENVEMARWA